MRTAIDRHLSTIEREIGINRAELGAPELWKMAVFCAIYKLAKRQKELMSDDIWREMENYDVEFPEERRAIGGLFVKAMNLGFIHPTEHFTLTEQVKSHRCPRRVWKSLLYVKLHPNL